MIEVSQLRRSFGSNLILDGVTFRVETGESVAIIGRSGGGKSVLLKHIIGLLIPDSGEVLIDGENLCGLDERRLLRIRQKFGMVFQGAALFDSMSVEENVSFALRRQRKLSAGEIRKKVARALEMVELSGTEAKRPSELSGGMRKRVGLARAIIYEPQIVLYDEPTTGLDPVVSDSIDQLMMRVRDVLNVTTVVVTHDMRTARRLGQRIFMLYDKRIYAAGTPDEIFDSTDPVVHRFVNGIANPKESLDMSNSRVEIKVGIFMFICLSLLAGLLIQFSKGVLFFRPTKTIILRAATVGGLRSRAQVLMSGVQVGSVAETRLAPEGTNVFIYLKIYDEFQVRTDARFLIEQSGFLGDQYVSIDPGLCKGQLMTNNATAVAVEPFNLLEVARSFSGFVQRLDETAKKLNEAINDIRRTVLNEHTLTNLSYTVDNLKQVSEDAIRTVDNINGLVSSNSAPAALAISNLVLFSEKLNAFARSAQDLLATNGPEVHEAVENIRTLTVGLTNMLSQIQSGKGVVGSLIGNQPLADDVSHIAANFSLMSSNLNRLGFWHWIWHKEVAPDTNAPASKKKVK